MGRKAKGKKSRGAGNASANDKTDEVEEDAIDSCNTNCPAAADGPVAKVQALLARMRLAEAQEALEEATSCSGVPEAELVALKAEISATRNFFTAEGVCAAEGADTSTDGADGRGRRLVTTRACKQGDVILREAPMLLAPRRVVTVGGVKTAKAFDVEAVRQAYSALKPLQQRLLWDFEASDDRLPAELADLVKADVELAPLVHFARVMSLNAHVYGPDVNKAALYVLGARANHSCNPSCGLAASGGHLLFYALRDMEAGEEVDYSYLGGHFTLYPTQMRKDQLLRVKFFECRCCRCRDPDEASAENAAADNASREQSLRSALLAKLLDKAASLEAAWSDPSKDVKQYILDWEALAEQSRKLLGKDHYAYARACFFALQALSTGKAHNLGGVTAERYNRAIDLYALPLIDYLKAWCPLGVRRVSLEPIGQALLLLAPGGADEAALLSQIVRHAGADDLRTCFYDESANAIFRRLLDRETAKQAEAQPSEQSRGAEEDASRQSS